ncbi:hypothetical protein ACRRRS_21730 (plasmid) [Brucella anthropi]|uniref:hypothetical protein n=1 Tax=Brucella anthropi TaxID=529 RepID=UPI003D7DA22A
MAKRSLTAQIQEMRSILLERGSLPQTGQTEYRRETQEAILKTLEFVQTNENLIREAVRQMMENRPAK